MSSFGSFGRSASEYIAEMQQAATTYPKVCLVLIAPGSSRLMIVWGADPGLADRLAALLEGPAYPLAVGGLDADDALHLQAVKEYAGQAWTHRYLVLLGERLRHQLDTSGG